MSSDGAGHYFRVLHRTYPPRVSLQSTISMSQTSVDMFPRMGYPIESQAPDQISARTCIQSKHKPSRASRLKMHRILSHILRLPVVLRHPADDSSLSVIKSRRTCTLNFLLTHSPLNPVLFYGLNFIRFFSIISFILVFAGSFYVMVTDIIAVNKFHKESRQPGKSAGEILAGCNYIRLRVTRQPHHTGCT